MMKLNDGLSAVTALGFDTPPVVYFIEAHPRYDALVTDIFQRVADGKLTGITSVITLTEVLILPIRHRDFHLQQEYRDLLTATPTFQTVPIDFGIAERAADLRARYNLRTPDALQMAAAITTGCQAFLTNDAGMKRVTELRVLVLDELEL